MATAVRGRTSAVFLGPYRFELRRRWDHGGPVCVWVMLNPSTADMDRDDPTIRRCVGLSRSWGDTGIIVVNLYALRTTNPEQLRAHPDPVGKGNDGWIAAAARKAARVVCAWGAHPSATRRAEVVTGILRRFTPRAELSCLGTTKSGAPRHPLYLPATTTPIPFGEVTS